MTIDEKLELDALRLRVKELEQQALRHDEECERAGIAAMIRMLQLARNHKEPQQYRSLVVGMAYYIYWHARQAAERYNTPDLNISMFDLQDGLVTGIQQTPESSTGPCRKNQEKP